MSKKYFVLVDFQNDFVHEQGALSVKNPQLIQRVQKFLNNLQQGMFEQMIVTADNHFAETYAFTEEARHYPPHCIHGSRGWHLAVTPKKNIPLQILYKGTTDMWQEAYAYPVLQQDWKGSEVYLGGVLSDVCVKQAMDGFLSRGAKVTLLEDLCQSAEKQVPEIVSDAQYRGAVQNGALRHITAAQFFRSELLSKKIMINTVYNQKGR